jgi:iron complex transport system substrate-binding protein
MIKQLFGFGLAILIFLSAPPPADAKTITDIQGRTVSVPDAPERIICLGPGALRLIVYLDAAESVAAVESMEKRNPQGRPYWIARPELHHLPTCGPGGPAAINKKPDMEAILQSRPQVIFATYMENGLADEVQNTLGIPMVTLDYGDLGRFDEAVYASLRIAGRVLNRSDRAGAVVDYIQDLIRDLDARTRNIPEDRRPRAFAGGIGYRGAHGIESTESDYLPLNGINAFNLANEVDARIGAHVFVDKEILLSLDPEIIFIDGGGLELVAADFRKKPEFYGALTAFKTGRVHALLPFNFYNTNIGTALADAYAAGKILYPGRFADVDPEKKADEIYTFMVGRPVYDVMARDYEPIGGRPGFLDDHQK